ncbi:hypothetical protein WN944_010922 [Citrus x changshan-huyou]|uniref:Cupin type-1 domain-containing protein n=1 Tax=Citrus x changshan-huyou TaxID=2935761 RepID=A0AAP0MV12_9ROSI
MSNAPCSNTVPQQADSALSSSTNKSRKRRMGLVHFKCNVGYSNVVAIVAFSSQNLGVVTIANTAFGSNPAIVTDMLAKAFQAEKKIVKQLQSTF